MIACPDFLVVGVQFNVKCVALSFRQLELGNLFGDDLFLVV